MSFLSRTILVRRDGRGPQQRPVRGRVRQRGRPPGRFSGWMQLASDVAEAMTLVPVRRPPRNVTGPAHTPEGWDEP